MRAMDTSRTPSVRPWFRVATVLLAVALTFVTAVGAAFAAPPASQQYNDHVPGANGHGNGGGNGQGGGKGKGKGEGKGKGGGKTEGGGKTNQQNGDSGALAALNDSGDDGGGLGTLGIILIILGVVLAGALVVAWLRSRQDAAPDAGPGDGPDVGPGDGPDAGPGAAP
jgi:hypothetical protein